MRVGTYVIALALLSVSFATVASAVSEDYVGQAAFVQSSHTGDCDADVNAGGACFHVPSGTSSVTVEIADVSGIAQSGWVTFHDDEGQAVGTTLDAFSADNGGGFVCGSGAFSPVSGVAFMRVHTADPVLGNECGLGTSVATAGTITATFS